MKAALRIVAAALILSIPCTVFSADDAQRQGQDRVYTWIDENGVVHYTNTAPPEGATVIDSEREIPSDPRRERQREAEQNQFLRQLDQQERRQDQAAGASGKEAQKAVEQKPEKARQQQEALEEPRRRQDTWHQRQIQKRQRKKLDQGPEPPGSQ